MPMYQAPCLSLRSSLSSNMTRLAICGVPFEDDILLNTKALSLFLGDVIYCFCKGPRGVPNCDPVSNHHLSPLLQSEKLVSSTTHTNTHTHTHTSLDLPKVRDH